MNLSDTMRLADFDKATKLKPDYAEAFYNKGKSLAELGRYDDALAAYQNALLLRPNLADASFGRASILFHLKRYDEALTACDKALASRPDLTDAWLARGDILSALRRSGDALTAYSTALTLKSDLVEAWLARGHILADLSRPVDALAAYDKALSLNPELAVAWFGHGNSLFILQRYEEAVASYEKALALKSDPFAETALFIAKLYISDWTNFESECANLISSVRTGNVIINPLSVLGISSPSAGDQLQCAKWWTELKHPPSDKPVWRGEKYTHDRIRIAYMSADFREHAVSSLVAGLFECHDKSQFQLTGISIGPDDNSEMRQRLKHSFEHFVDATGVTEDELVSTIREAEIDLLIDLNGCTQGEWTNILARRPAPIQVNYLGYPGTMGASYIDYIVADQTVIPDNHRIFYSEKIAVLPNSYLVNDRKRVVSDKTYSRSDAGLPARGFVFCCFNNNYKITPSVFDRWMRILKQAEGSVLWLAETNTSAKNHLRREAVAREIDPERLVFAERMPSSAEHLARLGSADLFLDTLPYNAHATAADALWVGLPVLTCIGETFAGRVAASVLNAIGLPELIAATAESYERIAVDLANHPEKLAAIKRKLAENRLSKPLFDTELFTRHIEAAYRAMYDRYQVGLPPDHIVVFGETYEDFRFEHDA
jgi:protein O-GlcNAc transferase